MKRLLYFLVLEEVLCAAGSLHEVLLAALLHLPLLLLFALELFLDMGHHFGQILHRPVFLPIFGPCFAAGFVLALFALHEDDAFVGLFCVLGVAFAVDELELFFGGGGKVGRVGPAMRGGLGAVKLGFSHRNYIDFKSANSKSCPGLSNIEFS